MATKEPWQDQDYVPADTKTVKADPKAAATHPELPSHVLRQQGGQWISWDQAVRDSEAKGGSIMLYALKYANGDTWSASGAWGPVLEGTAGSGGLTTGAYGQPAPTGGRAAGEPLKADEKTKLEGEDAEDEDEKSAKGKKK